MAQVVPAPLSCNLQHGVFKLEASRKLPKINARKTLKSALLAPANLKRYNQFIRRWRVVFNVSYLISAALTPVEVFAPAVFTRSLAPFVTLLALPTTIATLLSLRYDMVVLLLGTFDFWYRGFAIGVCAIAVALHVRDARALGAIAIISGNLVVLLMDANFRGTKSQVVILVAAATVMLFNATAVAFSWMEDVHDFAVFFVDSNIITVRSIVANGFGLSCLLFLQNAYVRRSFAQASTAQLLTTTTQCTIYNCRLQWKPTTSHARLTMERRLVKRSFHGKTIQFRCVGLCQVFNARKTLIMTSPESPLTPYHWSLRLALILSGAVGFMAMVATFAAISSDVGLSSATVPTLSIVSLVATVSVNAFFLVFVYQVEMLLLLYASFDFAFNFFLVFIVHMCLCSLSAWDMRVGAIVSSLLWMHWVCVIDAIPPIKRAQLGFNVRRVTAVIQTAFVVALVLLSIDLLVWNSQRFVNHDVLQDISNGANFSDSANWSVGSFFLNRVAGLVLWAGRALFRMVTYDDDELLCLRGVVEYDDYEASSRHPWTEESRAKLGAIVQALSERSQGPAMQDSRIGDAKTQATNGAMGSFTHGPTVGGQSGEAS